MDQLMFPLYFHYEDVSHQDPLLKPNHANVMEVLGSCKIIVVPKTAPSIRNGKLAIEISCGQKLKQRASTRKSFRSNPFLGSNKDKKGYNIHSNVSVRFSARNKVKVNSILDGNRIL
ncbi:hypothetical protein H5410_022058 [Solanum commersonii]|uniref:Uncharacterized protein n=1 Tax=Solanum commersonii TaxID=4109 RepID=A0A9J5ZD35_SOLCO|nr:hypothetical protein H5410_022058 [Solanum commersonii]